MRILFKQGSRQNCDASFPSSGPPLGEWSALCVTNQIWEGLAVLYGNTRQASRCDPTYSRHRKGHGRRTRLDEVSLSEINRSLALDVAAVETVRARLQEMIRLLPESCASPASLLHSHSCYTPLLTGLVGDRRCNLTSLIALRSSFHTLRSVSSPESAPAV